MPRYFLAFPLPADVRERLIALQPESNAALRILPSDELHLTLHFLGELSDVAIRSVCRRLAEGRFLRFSLQLRGVGQFPAVGPARVLWAGVELSSELQSLHRQLGSRLQDACGFVPDERPYCPHVTLARVNEELADNTIERFLEAGRESELPPFEVRQFTLYRSELINEVPRYAEMAVFDLVGSREKGSAGQAEE